MLMTHITVKQDAMILKLVPASQVHPLCRDRVTESNNQLGWKRPLRSWIATVNTMICHGVRKRHVCVTVWICMDVLQVLSGK